MDSKSVKIVRLDIDEMDDFSGVDAIALVEEPAIESNFIYFSKQDQNKEVFESYSDYPDSVSNNAKRGIELNEKVNNKCATQVGKVRAQQLAKKEAISVETIKRMYSYLSRAEVNYDESDNEACGTISYLLWGGLAAKRWSESKLKELGLFEGDLDVSGLPPYVNEGECDCDNCTCGKVIVKLVENAGGFSVGDYVSWTFAGRGDDADRGRGQITDLRVSGEVQVPQTDVTLTATEEEPVALIRTRSGKVVGQYTRNLRKIKKPDGFEEADLQIEKYVEELFSFLGYIDGLPVYSSKEEAMEVAEIAGCGNTYHEHQVGEFIVYMPCETHDPEYDSLLQKAHEEWMESRMVDGNGLGEGELDAIMDYLDSVGLDVEFSQDTFAGVTGGKQRRNVGDSVSFLDTPTTKIRYRYVVNPQAPSNKSGNSRNFCKAMMSRSGNVYRKEDINNASLAGANAGFGPNGSNQYNLFLYRGGNNCRHIWETVTFTLSDGKWVDSTKSVTSIADLIKPRDPQSPLGGVIGPLGIGAQFGKEDFSEQQVVAGPFMIPDKLIYRIDESGEYYVYFSKDTIKKIAYKYMENKYTDATNIEHDSYDPLKDVFVVESWIITDPDNDKSSIYSNGEKYPMGTWYGMMKIKNKEIWDEYVKEGKVKGFSVEGFFTDMLVNKEYQ